MRQRGNPGTWKLKVFVEAARLSKDMILCLYPWNKSSAFLPEFKSLDFLDSRVISSGGRQAHGVWHLTGSLYAFQ